MAHVQIETPILPSPMSAALDLVQRVAATSLPVLVTGESGVGKGVIARAIHEADDRRERPLVVVNMSAMPEGLFEVELFGSEPGAYTDADGLRIGHFERAADGTLVLDEIADLPLQQQTALLRVLQTRTITRVGGNDPIPVRARIVAITSADLLERVADGRFREDLYYRLAIAVIHVPPLRERLDELPRLVREMLGGDAGQPFGPAGSARAEWGISGPTAIDDDAVRALAEHDWPGNLRELGNVLARLSLEATSQHAYDHVARARIDAAAVRRQLGAAGSRELARVRTLDETIHEAIRSALAVAGDDIEDAARRLGISRATVYRRIKRASPRSRPHRRPR